jgi:hypothetical protein
MFFQIKLWAFVYKFIRSYIIYDSKFIIVEVYIWLQIQPCQIHNLKKIKLCKESKDCKLWILKYVCAL